MHILSSLLEDSSLLCDHSSVNRFSPCCLSSHEIFTGINIQLYRDSSYLPIHRDNSVD